MMVGSLHPVKRRSAHLSSWRRQLMVGCAAGATLTVAAMPDEARAQAFNATPFTQDGSVTYNRSTPGTETVTVNTPTAIVGWNINPPSQPGDPYVFLPGGATATFQNGSGTANFAVLNRIFGAGGAPVRFDGNVISRLTDAVTGVTTPGGTVIFQNTGGIIVGASAVFDVGSLVLTALNIAGEESGYGGGTFINSGGGLDFTGVPEPYDQAIEIEAGAQINALAEGSYVVLAAPRIIQGGNVYVNGNVGYIAGENASFTVNGGLFDIVLQNGSDDNPTPIIHTGSTGGPASTGASDPHRIYMITAPFTPSQAATMLLSGSIGFDEAVSASIENGEIILSSGITTGFGGQPKYAEGNIEITGGTFTSDVFARASRNIIATSQDGDLSFSGGFAATANERVRLGAVNGSVTVEGDFEGSVLGALDFENGYGGGFTPDFQPFGIDVTGGVMEITAENGQTVSFAGNVSLDASVIGEFEFDGDLDAGDGIGGTVQVIATGGGSVEIAGDLEMLATGTGASTDYVPDGGGIGQGGDANIIASDGTITVGGGLLIDVSGFGSRTNASSAGFGAGGSGGIVSINSTGGGITVAGASEINARGVGGAVEGSSDPAASGGQGLGGDLFISGFLGDIILGSSTAVDLAGEGGEGPAGGAGVGGFMSVNANRAEVALGDAFVSARGSGGASGADAFGGSGVGGTIFITTLNTSDSIITATSIEMIADGQGGAGVTGGVSGGGTIRVVADSRTGVIEFGDVRATANGFGGTGTGTGGSGDGGSIFVGIQEETGYGSPGPASITFGNTSLIASGTGGNGPVAGAGTGGDARVSAALSADVALASLNLIADGLGGSGAGSDGGAGQGGIASIIATGGSSITVANHISGTPLISATGRGGQNNGGGDLVGGAGTGGTLEIRALSGGAIALPASPGPAGVVRVFARGEAGAAAVQGGRGGIGTGGTIEFGTDEGSITGAGLQLSAFGLGGNSANTQANIDGGDGVGGTRLIYANNGGRLAIEVTGGVAGGTGGFATGSGIGGNGSGGLARLDIDGGIVDLVGTLLIAAQGGSGSGNFSGNTEAGTAVLRIVNGGVINSLTPNANLSVVANAFAASAAISGGNAQGGVVRVEVDSASSGSSIDAIQAEFQALGIGGDGFGGTGGAGSGGTIDFQTGGVGNDWTFDFLNLDAKGIGGSGVTGGAGTGGFANLGVIGGTLNVTDTLGADATGIGGTSGDGTGAGGDGTGGVSVIYVGNGGQLSFSDAVLSSNGLGGSGSTGGSGTGGIQLNSPFEAPSGGSFLSSFGGTVTGTSAIIESRGIGGTGASGAGGNGQGGSVATSAFNGPVASVIDLVSVSLDNSAEGGTGGPGAAGGNATAGDLIAAEANTLNGTLRVDNLSLASTAVGGAGGAGGRGGDAFGGFVQVGGTSGEGSGAVEGVVELGVVTADVSARGGAGGVNGGTGGDGQGGSATLLSRGGTLSADSVSFVANGTGGAGGGSGAGGRVAALLTTRFQTAIGSTNTIGAFTGIASGTGGAPANPASTPGIARYGLAFIDVVGSTASFGSASLTTSGTSDPLFSDLAQPVFIRAQGSSLGFTTLLAVDAAQAVNILPEGGTIALQGTANVFSGDSIAIAAVDSGSISGGTWNLDADGAVTIAHSNRGSAATVDVVSLTATGSDFTAGSGTLVRASGAIGVNVADLATIAGTVVSPDIFIASSDIDIAGTGFLGDAATTEITLSVNPQSAQTVIGGTSDEAGYTLTQAEVGRIRTASLEIQATPTSSAPSRPADLVVRDLTVTAAPTLETGPGAINRLQISMSAGEGAGGIVQVEGALRMENASTTSGIDIIAGERVQIINPSGSIRVLNGEELPAGSIGIQSANIWSASQEIIDQLISNPNFEGRNDALLLNEGDVEERGYIEAGDVLLRVGSTLLVQNSGTSEEFAGITVTQNTLTIEPTSQGQIDVYAFGRRINADGTFVTNTDYFREVAFGSRSGYSANAQFNTCFIASFACGGSTDQPVPIGSEIIEGPIEEVEDTSPPPNPDRQQFVDVSFASESLLEEPVTSGGDSGVWDEEGRDCVPGEVCAEEGEGQ